MILCRLRFFLQFFQRVKVSKSLKDIKILLSDVDGVMTDTTIYLDSNGDWRRHFSIYDGMGFKRLQEIGVKVGIITAADGLDVRTRFEFLGVDYFYEKSKNKIKDLEDVVSKTGIPAEQIAYIGDDLMDLEVIERVGFGVTVPHALDSIKEKSDYTTKRNGGHGAVREVCELIIADKEG